MYRERELEILLTFPNTGNRNKENLFFLFQIYENIFVIAVHFTTLLKKLSNKKEEEEEEERKEKI